MRTSRSHRWVLAAVISGLSMVFVGCTTIPVTGPVESADRVAPVTDSDVNITPADPAVGADPTQIVAGFLQAIAIERQGDAVARTYLSSDVRDQWNPSEAITVYSDRSSLSEVANGAVVLNATVVGRVNTDRSYLAGELLDPDAPLSEPEGPLVSSGDHPELRFDFEVIRDSDGEWRISNPPPGRLISQYLFNRLNSSASVFFYGPEFRSLVPDQIIVPRGVPGTSARLRALFNGPTEWLAPAVATAIPGQTQLSVQSAFVDSEGIVDVSMTGADLSSLGEDRRALLRDQIVASLADVNVSGVRLSVEGEPYRVPGSDQLGVVSMDVPSDIGPIPVGLGQQLFGATSSGVLAVDDNQGFELDDAAESSSTALIGVELRSLSPSLPGDRIAAVVADGQELVQASVGATEADSQSPPQDPDSASDGSPEVVVEGGELLRPQYVGGGGRDELWTIDAATTTVYRSDRGETSAIEAPALAGMQVNNFRIAPDGVRMALTGERDGRPVVGLVRIDRTDEVTVEGWRPLPIDGAGFDLGWMSDQSLMVLSRQGGRVSPWRVDSGGTEPVGLVVPQGWEAESIAVLPRHRNPRVVVTGPEGTWRYVDDATWRSVGPGLRALGFAG